MAGSVTVTKARIKNAHLKVGVLHLFTFQMPIIYNKIDLNIL
jgi:hypothetical protein